MIRPSSDSHAVLCLSPDAVKVRLPLPRAAGTAVLQPRVAVPSSEQILEGTPPPVAQPFLSCPACSVHLLGCVPGTTLACPRCGAGIAIAAAPHFIAPPGTLLSSESAVSGIVHATPSNLTENLTAVQVRQRAEASGPVARFERTGVFTFKPFDYQAKTENDFTRAIEFEKTETADFLSESSSAAKPSSYRKILLISLASGFALLVVVGSLALLGNAERAAVRASIESLPEPVTVVKKRLEQSARVSFKRFLNTSDPLEKSHWVIDGFSKVQAMTDRSSALSGLPTFSEEGDEIIPSPMTDEETRKGICAFVYRPMIDAPLFSSEAILPMDVLSGVTPPDALQNAILAESFSADDVKQGIAMFRLKDNRMQLDWDLFIQTLDRSLIAFRDGSLGSGPMRFRVVISLDKPVFENNETVDLKVFRIQDPLHTKDSLRLQVDLIHPDEPLLRLAFHDEGGEPIVPMQPRTATVDLVRNPESGLITLSKLVCWEFLGVGGTEQFHVER
jgi:hypothetical protein